MAKQELTCDVLIIGGGIAGMSAANRAAQLGKRVILVEKGTARNYPCNTRFSGGVFHIAHTDMTAAPDLLQNAITTEMEGFERSDQAATLAREAGTAIRWLRSEGTNFINLRTRLDVPRDLGHAAPHALAHHSWVLAPPSITRAGPDWDGKGGDVMLRRLEKNFIERKGTFLRGVRARALIMDAEHRCVGAEGETAEGTVIIRSFATVIADGGFQGNLDLLREYVSVHPEKLQQRNARSGTGDGLRMALEVGAATAGLDRFYGHLLSRDAMTNDRLWPKPQLDSLAVAGIVVTKDGRRFTDEGRGPVYLCNMIAGLDDPLSSFAVFDETVWNGPGARTVMANVPANPVLTQEGGTLFKAQDIAALAVLMGVPPEGLAQTVAAYNHALENGRQDDMSPARTEGRVKHGPIRTPPFYAAPLCAGITYTMGGILIDGQSRVVDLKGGVIRGLFAAGATTGGLEGGPMLGYVGGLSRSSVTGYCAAETIAAELSERE